MVRRKKKSWFAKLSFLQKSGVIAVAAVLIIITFYAGLFSIAGVDEPFVCSFDGSGDDVCVYNLTLEANRTVDSAFLVFGFDSVPSDEEFELSLSPLEERSVRDEDDDDNEEERAYVGLYKLPSSITNVHDFRVEARATGSVSVGGSGDRARAEIELMYVDVNYPYNFIQYCSASSRSDCSNEEVLLLHSYRRSNGDYNYVVLDDISFGNDTSQKRFSIRNDEPSESGEVFVEGHIPHDVYIKHENFAFIVMPWSYDRSASASITHPAVVKAFYREALFPSDVLYSVGGVQINILEGEQKESVVSIGVGDVINSYCRRSVSVSDCVVPIEIKSSTAGVVTVLEQIDKKFAVIADVPSPIIINNTVVEETIVESTTETVVNQTIIERITDGSFKPWYWYVIIGVPIGLFVLGLIIFIRRR